MLKFGQKQYIVHVWMRKYAWKVAVNTFLMRHGLVVEAVNEVFISNPAWYCGLCLEPINDESESSIICDSCLTWCHFHLKSFPRQGFGAGHVMFDYWLLCFHFCYLYSSIYNYHLWFFYYLTILNFICISTPTALGVVSITGTIALNYMSSYISIGTALHQHLNSIEPSIQFTVEMESNGCLPFLNIFISRRNDGSLSTSVYCKQTYNNQYL